MKKLNIVYEDDSCIVVNKPAGLAVQGGKGISVSLDSILAETWSRYALEERPLLVHRLDRDTSGLVLVAKNKMAAAHFSRLFAEKQAVVKRYRAICKGKPVQPEGVITDDLFINGSVKKSETRYRLLGTGGTNAGGGEEFSLLELELGTGRMHQIRRHLAAMGNPILGDDKYGDFKLNHTLRKTMKLHHLLLHASQLIISGKTLNAPLPDYFEKTLCTISFC